MKTVERLLIALSSLAVLGILVLGLFWAGLAVRMIAFGTADADALTTRMPAISTTPASDDDVSGDVVLAKAQTSGAAAGNTAAGEKVFKKCKACHTADAKARNKTGPALWAVIGRPIASIDGFKYSQALQDLSAQSWDVATLDKYLAEPKAFAPGTKMSFAGLKKPADRTHLIAYLGQQSGDAMTAAAAQTEAGTPAMADAEPEVIEIEPVAYPQGVTYANAPAISADQQAEIDRRVASLVALAETLDYERARFHPLHFPPNAASASNAECLVCHQEIISHTPRETSPAGVPASDTIAWYQTLDTYAGDQQSFHYRHLQSDFAKEVMTLQCSFCHKGNDPREESPDMVPTRATLTAASSPEFTLRKMVNPSDTCLRCHGDFPEPEIMGLDGPWHQVRADLEYPEAPNGCLSCHAETYRTERHAVSYLNAENIEQIARQGSSDSCYGCHGGRAWYRISFPYPRHDWPDMDTETPEWAVDRPTASDPRYALPASE